MPPGGPTDALDQPVPLPTPAQPWLQLLAFLLALRRTGVRGRKHLAMAREHPGIQGVGLRLVAPARSHGGGLGRCFRSDARDLLPRTRPTGPLTHRYPPPLCSDLPAYHAGIVVLHTGGCGGALVAPLYRFGATSIVRGVPYCVAVPCKTVVPAAPGCERRVPLTQPTDSLIYRSNTTFKLRRQQDRSPG